MAKDDLRSRVAGRLGARLTVMAVVAAFGGVSAIAADTARAAACVSAPLSFRAPVTLGTGYEPGVDVAPDGTIYVSGAGNLQDGASPVWRSVDGGRTYAELLPLSGAAKRLEAAEGDTAVNAAGQLFYMDTWVAENHVYRFSDRGDTLDFVKPVTGTAGLDDRPWLAADDEDVVHYSGNTGFSLNSSGARILYRSVDGGLTFDPLGHTIPESSNTGFIDADPTSDYVYATSDSSSGAGRTAINISISPDQGETWTFKQIATTDPTLTELGLGSPVVGVSPVDGVVSVTWSETDPATGTSVLWLARSRDRGATWQIRDVTPFKGELGYFWSTVAPNGDVGMVFTADPASVRGSKHFVYAMIWRERGTCQRARERCSGSASAFRRVSAGGFDDAITQDDFFQVDFTPSNTLVVPYSVGTRYRPGSSPVPGSATKDTRKVTVSHQSGGPNVRGAFCGHSGQH